MLDNWHKKHKHQRYRQNDILKKVQELPKPPTRVRSEGQLKNSETTWTKKKPIKRASQLRLREPIHRQRRAAKWQSGIKPILKCLINDGLLWRDYSRKEKPEQWSTSLPFVKNIIPVQKGGVWLPDASVSRGWSKRSGELAAYSGDCGQKGHIAWLSLWWTSCHDALQH